MSTFVKSVIREVRVSYHSDVDRYAFRAMFADERGARDYAPLELAESFADAIGKIEAEAEMFRNRLRPVVLGDDADGF